MLHAWGESDSVSDWVRVSVVPAYHHDNVREDVTVLVDEGADAASSQCHLFAESGSLRVFLVLLFCNYIFSFYFFVIF